MWTLQKSTIRWKTKAEYRKNVIKWEKPYSNYKTLFSFRKFGNNNNNNNNNINNDNSNNNNNNNNATERTIERTMKINKNVKIYQYITLKTKIMTTEIVKEIKRDSDSKTEFRVGLRKWAM